MYPLFRAYAEKEAKFTEMPSVLSLSVLSLASSLNDILRFYFNYLVAR